MTNEQMLKELIELAVENGWETRMRFTEPSYRYLVEQGYAAKVLFNHEFARAAFGEASHKIIEGSRDGFFRYPLSVIWKYKLQQLAITPEEKRIQYSWENRRTV